MYTPYELFGSTAPFQPLPVTETAASRQLSLLCYPAMTDQDVERVIRAVRALWA